MFFPLLEDIPNEIAMARIFLRIKSSHHFLLASGQMSTTKCFLRSRNTIDEEGLEKPAWSGETTSSLFQDTDFYRFEDEGDPVVELFVFEAAKRFAEGEVAYYIEGCEVAGLG